LESLNVYNPVLFAVCALIFIVVQAFLLGSALRLRRSERDGSYAEIGWTLLTFGLTAVVLLFVFWALV
jgi:heme/copper-type cytochrome/quinol oxidase subunit 2